MSADDPDRPPTDEEVAASQKLRDGLDADPLATALKAAWSPDAIDPAAHTQIVDDVPTAEELTLAGLVDEDEMVLALKAAWNPGALDEKEHRAIVDRATGRAVIQLRSSTRMRVAIVTATTVFAMAAGIVLWITAGPGPRSEVALARVRSTQPLFDQPFKEGETSARIDRIALARASDYRDNYFARKGVR